MMPIMDVGHTVDESIGTDSERECATAEETSGNDTTGHVGSRDAEGIGVLSCCGKDIGNFFS